MQPIPVMESTISESRVQASFILKVYNWMTMGLAITALVSLAIAMVFQDIRMLLLEYPFLFWGTLILELALVWGLSAAINRIPIVLAIFIFLFYAALNGVTLSLIFLVYKLGTIAYTFFITAAMFGTTSIFGFITRMDLSRIGGILTMALIGLIIASVANIFVQSTPLEWLISYAGVVIFVGLTAWDTQKIKKMSMSIESSSEEGNKASIMGALTLYLDFINLFLLLLRIMGRSRD
jgi:FtsH-binding integral membrane protein